MLYGGETWELTGRLTSILLGCDRKMLRYIYTVYGWSYLERSCELFGGGREVVVVVVLVVGQTVGSISSKTLAYDCLYTLELCTASMIATS